MGDRRRLEREKNGIVLSLETKLLLVSVKGRVVSDTKLPLRKEKGYVVCGYETTLTAKKAAQAELFEYETTVHEEKQS